MTRPRNSTAPAASAVFNAPVLVVGAGPVGLAAACELLRYGVDCHIIDEGDGPTPIRESRAFGIHARTLEVLEDMGASGPILQAGRRVRAITAHDRGRPFARLDPDFDGTDTPFPFILSLSQGKTEQTLVELLASRDRHVDWRTKLIGLSQTSDGVTAALRDADGRERSLRVEWLIGCDGAHSAVRHQLGLSFEGVARPERFLLADVQIDWDLPPDSAHLLMTRQGLVAALPLPEPGLWRLIDTTGASNAESSGQIVARFRELLGMAGFAEVRIDEPLWTSAFHIHRRAVEQLRVGRCFLAGDAAHIHSPVGGQGMNTGIQDVYNLAWKLALVIQQTAPESLLDSYDAERLPVAKLVLRSTQLATSVVTLRNPLARMLRNYLARFLTKRTAVRQRITRNVSELAVHYRASPIVTEDWNGTVNEGPRPGERVPDVRWRSPSGEPHRLFELLRGTQSTLLLFDRTIDEKMASLIASQRLPVAAYLIVDETSAAKPGDELPRLVDAEGTLHRRFGAPSLYFVRPDGYLGYRSCPPDADRFAAYLRRLSL